MSNLETNGSPQLELVRSFHEGIAKGDMSLAGKTLHKDHRRLTHPRSVGKPVQTKEEYLQHTGGLASFWAEECKVSRIFHCPILLAPWLNRPHSWSTILSLRPQEKSYFTFVSQTFRPIPRCLTTRLPQRLPPGRRPQSGWIWTAK